MRSIRRVCNTSSGTPLFRREGSACTVFYCLQPNRLWGNDRRRILRRLCSLVYIEVAVHLLRNEKGHAWAGYPIYLILPPVADLSMLQARCVLPTYLRRTGYIFISLLLHACERVRYFAILLRSRSMVHPNIDESTLNT